MLFSTSNFKFFFRIFAILAGFGEAPRLPKIAKNQGKTVSGRVWKGVWDFAAIFGTILE